MGYFVESVTNGQFSTFSVLRICAHFGNIDFYHSQILSWLYIYVLFIISFLYSIIPIFISRRYNDKSSTSLDLENFLVDAYAKQIKELNSSTGKKTVHIYHYFWYNILWFLQYYVVNIFKLCKPCLSKLTYSYLNYSRICPEMLLRKSFFVTFRIVIYMMQQTPNLLPCSIVRQNIFLHCP